MGVGGGGPDGVVVLALEPRVLDHLPARGPIAEGSIIVLRFGAGNHDPAVFPDPDTFDLRRTNARRHFAFGVGPHYCVGNLLARSEMRLTIARLLQRMRNWRLVNSPDAVQWQAHFFAFGPSRLEIAFDRI